MRKPIISLETVAAMCHAANREFCKANGEETLHKPWDECTESEKNVSVKAMKELLQFPDLIHTSPVELLSVATWEEWKRSKTAEGWTYGKTKDVVAKTHPCLVDNYDQLSAYEKVKDQIYLSIMKMIMENYEILI
jgi:hypothetical protein